MSGEAILYEASWPGTGLFVQMPAQKYASKTRWVGSARLVDLFCYSVFAELAKLIWVSFSHVTRIERAINKLCSISQVGNIDQARLWSLCKNASKT